MPLDLVPHIGTVIRSLRKEAGIAQEEAADIAEVDRSYWSAIERGANRNPSVMTLQKFAFVFGVGLDEVFNRARAMAEAKPSSKPRAVSVKKS